MLVSACRGVLLSQVSANILYLKSFVSFFSSFLYQDPAETKNAATTHGWSLLQVWPEAAWLQPLSSGSGSCPCQAVCSTVAVGRAFRNAFYLLNQQLSGAVVGNPQNAQRKTHNASQNKALETDCQKAVEF